MFQTRSLTTGFLVASLGIAGGLALFTAPNASAGGTPCTGKQDGVPGLAEACTKGGKEEAKKLMNTMVKKATGAGEKVKCADCHEDSGPEYKTKADAQKQFDEKVKKHL